MISGTPTMSTMIERGQAELPIIAEAIAAGAHHQHVALVADGRKEVAGRADGDRHEKRIGVVAELGGEARGDRRHHQNGGCIVEKRCDRHGRG